MTVKIKTDNLIIVCTHVLNGKSVFHQTKNHLLCKKCFNYYNRYSDKNGRWNIPKTEKFENLHTVCRDCVNQLAK